MLHRTLNLGILAHVDAGKTTLTERLLHAAGIIDEIGSVDAGTTQTDSLALERQRGITIKSAVASFSIDDVTVNLIDTPGHPDFIAEVERVLQVLDGAVLVVSAVEGVQAQTRILMRALDRLHVPTIIFVNKLDRRGADAGRTLRAIRKRLPVTAIPLGEATGGGTRAAGFEPWEVAASQIADGLAEHDDAILEARVEERSVPSPLLRQALVKQTGEAAVHPVVFGSAVTGAGVPALMSAIAELLPAAAGEREEPAQATIFKIERGPSGEQIAYVRMFAGRLRVRDRLQLADGEHTVTAIAVFDQGAAVRRRAIAAGEIGRLWGLAGVRIGDAIGDARPAAPEHQFALPTLETVVTPRRPGDRGRLRVALGQLAEQDPLINVRQDDVRQELSVSLYGEVQKEVIQATLEGDFGVEVDFRESTTICVERVAGTGSAVERLHQRRQPVSGDGRAARRAGGTRRRRHVPPSRWSWDRCRCAFFRAVEDTVPGHARAGAPWLAGGRLRGRHDALRIPGKAWPGAPVLRQEPLQHGRGLSRADAARRDGRVARVPGAIVEEPGAPVPARGPRRHSGPGDGRAGQAGGGRRQPAAGRRHVHAGGRDPGSRRPPLQPAPARADPRRGPAGDGVRPSPAGPRRRPRATAV